jgi:hypothetical protein
MLWPCSNSGIRRTGILDPVSFYLMLRPLQRQISPLTPQVCSIGLAHI